MVLAQGKIIIFVVCRMNKHRKKLRQVLRPAPPRRRRTNPLCYLKLAFLLSRTGALRAR